MSNDTDGREETDGGVHRKQATKPHPDWFWSMSGGIDSTAAFLLTRKIGENYSKRPVMVYFDTRVGLPANRLYLERLADEYDQQLWTLRTEEKFEEWVARDGPPGPGAHGHVRNELKGRQSSKLNTLADNPVHIIGLRAEESANRARFNKVEEKRRHVEVYPVHRLTKRDCVRIILEADAPINPGWLWNHFTDCGCLANGDPSELDAIDDRFPWFAQRMREIEEAADASPPEDTLGWGGLTAIEEKALRQGHEQMTLCGESCGRRTVTTDVEKALLSRVDGASIEEAVSVLDESALQGSKGVLA